MKLTPQLMNERVSVFKKIQGILHMSGYAVHPLMLVLSCLALPFLGLVADIRTGTLVFALLSIPLAFAIVAPSTLYLLAQKSAYQDWGRRVLLLPFLVVVGVGFALSNSRAIAEAGFGKQTDFVRTPKRGDREIKKYAIRLPWIAFAEILLGTYSAVTLAYYLTAGKYLVSPFLAIYAAGFLFVGLLTLGHSLGLEKRYRARAT
jgi:hypothetical protein